MDPAVLHTADTPSTRPPLTPKPNYTRLTRSDVGVLLKLHKDGLTQMEIAKRLGCDQTTVSNWLVDLNDTTDVAKSYLRGQGLRMAQNIVRKGLPRDHVATLKGIGVLEDVAAQGFTVNIGIADSAVQVVLTSSAPGRAESE